MNEPAQRPPMSPGLKLAIEMGPLLLFFVAQRKFGLLPATAVLMVGMAVSLILSRVLGGKLPVMPVITTVFVLIMGGLTLLLQDETFIKMKPTIVHSLIGTLLLGGLLFRRMFLKMAMGPSLEMVDAGWRKLTVRVGIYFLLLAVLNEYVWRTVSEDDWVTFKTFGIMPLTFVFLLSQVPLIQRYGVEPAEAEGGDGPAES